MHIIISGIGSVGGYFGGKIAKFCSTSTEHEVSFFARKHTVNSIKKTGLQLNLISGTTVIHPHKISNNANDLGIADLIILSTKTYDLEHNLKELSSCVSEKTVFLSLLNGIQNEQFIKKIFPNNEVWNGFVFMFANREQYNIIKETALNSQLWFGEVTNNEKSAEFQKILKNSEINGGFSSNCVRLQWEKFFFISCMASITSYKKATFGEIESNTENLKILHHLIEEFIIFAKSHSQIFTETDKAVFWSKFKLTPKNNRTSMALDFLQNKTTELETLTGIVAKSLLDLPYYKKIYHNLIS